MLETWYFVFDWTFGIAESTLNNFFLLKISNDWTFVRQFNGDIQVIVSLIVNSFVKQDFFFLCWISIYVCHLQLQRGVTDVNQLYMIWQTWPSIAFITLNFTKPNLPSFYAKRDKFFAKFLSVNDGRFYISCYVIFIQWYACYTRHRFYVTRVYLARFKLLQVDTKPLYRVICTYPIDSCYFLERHLKSTCYDFFFLAYCRFQ